MRRKSLAKLRISSEMLLSSLTGKKRQKVHILKKKYSAKKTNNNVVLAIKSIFFKY